MLPCNFPLEPITAFSELLLLFYFYIKALVNSNNIYTRIFYTLYIFFYVFQKIKRNNKKQIDVSCYFFIFTNHLITCQLNY